MKHEVFNTNVLIRIERGEIKSEGGIILATDGSREGMAREEGVLESIGSNAFGDFGEDYPKVGDKVMFARYAGKTCGTYKDGFERRVLEDINVLARIVED